MINPDYLERLENFRLALKKQSLESLQGRQKSEREGQGLIFKDHKEYTPGDDIRRVDWNAYARTGDYYVRRFEEEKALTVHVLVDRSSSMDYGSPTKYDQASKIGLAIAYLANSTSNRFRYSAFSETVTDLTAARRNANMVDLLETVNSLRKTPESRFTDCLSDYRTRISNKSAVIIISDFLSDLDDLENGLEALKTSETVLVQVLDEEEYSPSMKGARILEEPETGSKLRTFLSRTRKKKYRDRLQQHIEGLEQSAAKTGSKFVEASTGDDPLDVFQEAWRAVENA